MSLRIRLSAACFLLFAGLLSTGAGSVETTPVGVEAASINWMSWDAAMKAQANAPKRVMVDVYTDWSGWNKRMDSSTYKDPRVVEYINANFYAVKLDAESKNPITYKGTTYTFEKSGNRGVHGLAAMLLDDRLSYPVIVYLDAELNRTMISPGFKDADKLLAELELANGQK